MKKYLPDILFIAVVVLMTLQISSWFRRTPPNEKLIRSEMQIETLQQKIKADSINLLATRQWYDSLITQALQDDKAAQQKYQSVKIVYEKIPVTVRNLSNEDLRRAIYQFRP